MGDLIIHPVTGEVIDDPAAVAREWVRLHTAITEAEQDLAQLRSAQRALEPAMRACATPGRVDGDAAWVVLSPPPRRAAQRVDVVACQRHREQLDVLGLGGEKTTWSPPTAADLRREGARLAAAGVDLDELLPEPPPAPHILTVVPKEA